MVVEKPILAWTRSQNVGPPQLLPESKRQKKCPKKVIRPLQRPTRKIKWVLRPKITRKTIRMDSSKSAKKNHTSASLITKRNANKLIRTILSLKLPSLPNRGLLGRSQSQLTTKRKCVSNYSTHQLYQFTAVRREFNPKVSS